ncbi:MAG: hypothetical protein OMM_09351, partial [Candidatus Magnetoglobus multicellularis str. Araruama]
MSMDTYSLSLSGGKWDYAIRNAADIATIDTIAVDTGYTGIFLVKVDVPLTNVANGDADIITISAMSQGNNSITFTTQVTTTTPIFSYSMANLSESLIVQPGNSYNYNVQIENTGANNDTYNISHIGGNFSYVIRNKDDYATIDTLSVDAGSTGTFLVKVTVPGVGLTNAQADTVTIHTVSQGNGNVASDYSITTQTPLFATRLARLENNAFVYPGKSYNYPVFIENNGSGTDAYNLSVLGGSWDYQIRNSLNTSAIQTIILNPGASDKFLVRVTVPFTGVANGASDTITVQAVSQALNTVDSRIEITTNSPYYEFKLKKRTPNQTVFLGETVDYFIHLNNTGAANDCYSLTVSGGNWSYTLRNADDNTNISSIPLPSGYSDTFILRVTMPQTGISSGEAETVTVKAKSQNNETVSDQVLVTTASPLYDFNAYRINFPESVNTEETTNFKLFINNTGNIIDTYQLSITGGKWTYAIRNTSNTSDITSMTLGSGNLDSFIVSAYVPITNVSNGDTDAITLSVESKGNPSVTASIPFVLTAINYSFNLEKNYDNAHISPGKSAVYELQINNTDQSDDTYLLSVQDSDWSYVFRNASDTRNITRISVPAMNSQEFFVKVIVPLHGTSEGMIETATVHAVSMGKSSVTDQLTIHSKVSPEASFAYFQAIKETNDATVNIGRSYDYRIQVVNYGISADEYHLDFSGGAWSYAIRNQNDISDIGCMTVMPNASRSFIVRTTVPQQATTGDSDTVLVRVKSNNSGFGANISLTTTANQYYALSFDGSNFMTISHQNTFNVNPASVEAWICPTTLSTNANENPIISKLASNSGWELRAHTKPEFVAYIDGVSQTVTSSKSITPNIWTHITATYDDHSLKLYINEELCGTKTIQGSITDNTIDVSIARSSLNTGNTFNGHIDDVRLWNTAITQQQVIDYQELNLKGKETGLIANWQFEEGTGTTINDSSTNAIHTSIANPLWISSPVTLSDVTYAFNIKSTNAIIEQGQTHQYRVEIENTGPTIDTYSINMNGGAWSYTLLDALGTSSVNSITLSSGYSATVIVEVNLPTSIVCDGDHDQVTLTVSSQNNTDLVKQKIISSTATYATPISANDFAFKQTKLTEYNHVQMGDSLYYLFTVENTGTYCNDFSMKRMGGSMDYQLYDESDQSSVDNFTLRPGENKTIVLKTLAPQTGYTIGDMDLTILKLDAHGDAVTEYRTYTSTVSETLPDDMVEFRKDQKDSDIPMARNMNYSYCQSIYLKEEIQQSGAIFSLFFEHNQAISETFTNVDIYMGITNKREFSSTSDWIPLTQLTKVYSGNLYLDANKTWDGILLLDNLYIYDTDNGHLVIAIDDNSGQGKADRFYSSQSIMNRTLAFSDNSTNPDPNSPPNGALKSAYPNIRFTIKAYDPYGVELTRFTHDSGIRFSESLYYSLTIENKGLNPDTYTFTTNGEWTYLIRNADDTSDINSISLNVNASKSFWLKVTAPSTGVSDGYIDSLTLTAGSQGNPLKTHNLEIKSTALNQNTVEIQKQRLENISLPIEPEMVYTYSQSIYQQSLIDRQGVITSIALQYNGYTTWQDDIDIYMGHTPKNAFNHETDWIPAHRLTQVYSGPLTVSKNQNWIKINLENPFFYNNTNHLVIAIDENKTNAHSVHDKFFCTQSNENTGLIYTQDIYYAIDPTPEFPSQGQMKFAIPNIRIEIPPVGDDQVQIVRLNEDKDVEIERTYNYTFRVFNNGSTTDTIDLATSSGSWTYTVRDRMDTQDISSIGITAYSQTEV